VDGLRHFFDLEQAGAAHRGGHTKSGHGVCMLRKFESSPVLKQVRVGLVRKRQNLPKLLWVVQSISSGFIQIDDPNSSEAPAAAIRGGHGTLGVGGA
jgi:hypothetical protein